MGSGSKGWPKNEDWYGIDAVGGIEGEAAFLEPLSFCSAGAAYLRQIDPIGVETERHQLYSSDIGKLDLPISVVHVLEAGRKNNPAVDTYSFVRTSVPDPDAFTITIGDTISAGFPASDADEIEVPGTVDQYTFSSVA